MPAVLSLLVSFTYLCLPAQILYKNRCFAAIQDYWDLPASDPVNNFEFGTFNRLCSIIIRYSKVSFFILRFSLGKGKIVVFLQVTENFRTVEDLLLRGMV